VGWAMAEVVLVAGGGACCVRAIGDSALALAEIRLVGESAGGGRGGALLGADWPAGRAAIAVASATGRSSTKGFLDSSGGCRLQPTITKTRLSQANVKTHRLVGRPVLLPISMRVTIY